MKACAQRGCTQPKTVTTPRAITDKWLATNAHLARPGKMPVGSRFCSRNGPLILAKRARACGQASRTRVRKVLCRLKVAEQNGQVQSCLSTAAELANCSSLS